MSSNNTLVKPAPTTVCGTCGGSGINPACGWDVLEGESPCDPPHPCPECREQNEGGGHDGRRSFGSGWFDLGRRVDELRRERRVPLAAVAETLKLDAAEVELLIAGVRSITEEEVAALAELLGVSVSELLS